MHPGSGDAPASEASLQADFAGHVVADMVVPEGGPGDVEVGMIVPACVEGGGCSDQRAPFEIAGVGAPPEAAPEDLIGAEILPLVGDTVVGREFPVAVNVEPRGLWDVSALPLPDHLLVVARIRVQGRNRRFDRCRHSPSRTLGRRLLRRRFGYDPRVDLSKGASAGYQARLGSLADARSVSELSDGVISPAVGPMCRRNCAGMEATHSHLVEGPRTQDRQWHRPVGCGPSPSWPYLL